MKFLNACISSVRGRWSQPGGVRSRLPSPEHSAGVYDDDDDEEEEGEEELERTVLSDPDEDHIYQSLEMQERSPVNDKIYALPMKRVQYSQYNLGHLLIM